MVTRTHLGGRVIVVIVRLVVFVPLIAGVHSVEVLGLAGPVLVMPPVNLKAEALQTEGTSWQEVCAICRLVQHCVALDSFAASHVEAAKASGQRSRAIETLQ